MKRKLLVLLLISGIFLVCSKSVFAETKGESKGLKGVSLGFDLEVDVMPGLDGFYAESSSGSYWYSWSSRTEISGGAMLGPRAYLRLGFHDNFGIEGSFAYLIGGDDISLALGRVNAIGMFNTDGMFRPYIKGGIVYGQFQSDFEDFADVEFDSGVGFEGGAGFELGSSTVAWTLNLTGRSLKNEVNPSSGVTVSDDELDLSGFILTTGVVFKF